MFFYNDLEAKKESFICKRIDTLEELAMFIKEQNDYKPTRKTLLFGSKELPTEDQYSKRRHYIIYRGIKESKFHLNTSLQLHWENIIKIKKNTSQQEYLSELVASIKNNDTIKQYEDKKRARFTDIGIVALMQHYGLPTPLMDWTPDIKTGLNFASDGMANGKNNNEITKYVSLYYINLWENNELEKSSYQNILYTATEDAKNIVSSINYKIDYSSCSLNSLFQLKDLDLDYIYIDYAEDAPHVTDIFGSKLDLINPNLEKQSGAFIINLNEECFLEQLWNRKIDSDNDIILEKKTIIDKNTGIKMQIESTQNPFAKGIIPNTKICCADIKKSVLKEWLSNGGQICHYNESNESESIKRAICSEYNRWLSL